MQCCYSPNPTILEPEDTETSRIVQTDKTTFFMQWLLSFWNLLPLETVKAVGNSPIGEGP